MAGDKSLYVAFCHPDLGLGGAERLVVDAACELCNHGHEVQYPFPTALSRHASHHFAAWQSPVADSRP